MTNLITLHASEDISAITEVLEEDGCVVIEGLLDPYEVSHLNTYIKHSFDKNADINGNFFSQGTKKLGGIFSKHSTFQKMAISNPIIEIVDHFLLASCSDFQINKTEVVSHGVDQQAPTMRRYDSAFPLAYKQGYEAMVNCVWAINEMDASSSATALIPGSHKWSREEAAELSIDNVSDQHITYANMKAGSALIHLGSVYHCNNLNTNSQQSYTAEISYSLGWLRQTENSYLAYSKQEVAAMPERLRHLLGYFVHQPALGYVGNINPYDYFLNDKREATIAQQLPDIYPSTFNANISKQNRPN